MKYINKQLKTPRRS